MSIRNWNDVIYAYDQYHDLLTHIQKILTQHHNPKPYTHIELTLDDANDGNLEVHEVFGMDLTESNLVVLYIFDQESGRK